MVFPVVVYGRESWTIKKVKNDIREELKEHGICHAILETEDEA